MRPQQVEASASIQVSDGHPCSPAWAANPAAQEGAAPHQPQKRRAALAELVQCLPELAVSCQLAS